MQRVYRKSNYQNNPEIYKKYQKEVPGMSKNKYIIRLSISFNKLNKDSIIFYTICRRSLYQRSVRLFKHEKYHILTAQMYHPLKSFNTKLDICETS